MSKKRAVLTEEGKYSNNPKEDKGLLINQGIGDLNNGSISDVNNVNQVRTIVNTSN